MVAVGVARRRVEQLKGNLRQIFCGRHAVQNDCFVIRHGFKEINDWLIAGKNKKRVIPEINYMLLGKVFDLREIHHHAICCIAGFVDNVTG